MKGIMLISLGLIVGFDGAGAKKKEGKEPKKLTDSIVTKKRSFILPVKVPEFWFKHTERLCLWVSRDQGKSWEIVSTISPNESHFSYRCSENGIYWFSLQIVCKDGTKNPPDNKQAALLKVQVEAKPEVEDQEEDLPGEETTTGNYNRRPGICILRLLFREAWRKFFQFQPFNIGKYYSHAT